MKHKDDYLTLANKRYNDNKRKEQRKARSNYNIQKLKSDTVKQLQRERLEHQEHQAQAKRKNSIIITLISVISFIGLILICCAVGRGKM